MCLMTIFRAKMKMSKIGSKNALFGYFRAEMFLKNYDHIWSQHLEICQKRAFNSYSEFWYSVRYFWRSGVRFLRRSGSGSGFTLERMPVMRHKKCSRHGSDPWLLWNLKLSPNMRCCWWPCRNYYLLGGVSSSKSALKNWQLVISIWQSSHRKLSDFTDIYRSNHRRCSVKNIVLKDLAILH